MRADRKIYAITFVLSVLLGLGAMGLSVYALVQGLSLWLVMALLLVLIACGSNAGGSWRALQGTRPARGTGDDRVIRISGAGIALCLIAFWAQ